MLPNIDLLIEGFSQQHTTNKNENAKTKASILTVGARALCKHNHRCSDVYLVLKLGILARIKRKRIREKQSC